MTHRFVRAAAYLALMLSFGAAQAEPAAKIEKLRTLPKAASAEQEYACTKDRVWCVSYPLGEKSGAGSLSILHMENGDLRWLGSIPLSAPQSETAEDSDGAEYAPWLSVVRFTPMGEPETALIGIAQTHNVGYSGGGASVTTVRAYEIRADHPGDFRVAFDAPLSADIDTRACFNDADVKHRLGACSDQYSFLATLTPAGGTKLNYKSRATTYPGKISRGEDSTVAPPLKKSDLHTFENAQCSLTRTLTRDVASGAFIWDAPLPACSDFLEP